MVMTAPRVDEARLPGTKMVGQLADQLRDEHEHLLHQPGQGGPTLHDR
jgi:hypothetical protein